MTLSNYPDLELNYNDLKSKISNFNSIFDRFLQDERKQLLNNRNEYLKEHSNIYENQKKTEKTLDHLRAREQSLNELLEKERVEREATEQEIQTIQGKADSMRKRRQTVVDEIERCRLVLTTKRQTKEDLDSLKRKQEQLNMPELQFWQDYLGLRMEGVHEEVIRFVFTNIDEKDWNKPFSFQINLAQIDYKVTHCRPPVPNLDDLVNKLNQSRDFYQFLRDIRKSFSNYHKNRQS
ncbi:kinetochore protein Spc25 [Schizosaccharomyces cryophilus OY26]|uniref:Kinetochore protein SPC25 n=1 Tax=Schizosaccharomyces cryophilus (strain OY26 / ATCC MYA-4695 / CBS 11777 / NBRC 106824 / NRRL Y48691) TaxID=653667 RepID=S9XJ02_SCHCR|nr:kinetochore protein Spc25 [Schizosaccharomyces cryophilus OY26]EPY53611.1 kinetochore protein Spc25 [Schizosaccharomyces cryophilus OY26]